MVVSLVGVVAVALRGFGDSCEPIHPWPWRLAYTALAMPVALGLVHAAREWLASAGVPDRPGAYLLEEELVVLARGQLTSLPVRTIVGVDVSRPWFGRARMAIWGETAHVSIAGVRLDDARALVRGIERIRVARRNSGYRQAHFAPPDALSSLASWSLTGARPSFTVWGAWAIATLACSASLGLAFARLRDELAVREAVAGAIGADSRHVVCLTANGEIVAAFLGEDQDVMLEEVAYARAVRSGDWESFLHDHPTSSRALLAARRLREARYATVRNDAWRLRDHLARFPDDPHRAELEARLALLGRTEAVTLDDARSYAYVARESVDAAVAAEMTELRVDRFDRVRDALRERHGDVEAVEFFEGLLAYVEAHDVEVSLRVGTRIDAPRDAFDPLGQTASELREAVLRPRLHAAFAEMIPEDVFPLVGGPPLPHRTDAEARRVLLEDMAPSQRPSALLRLAAKEDDDTGQPEIRVVYRVTEADRALTGRFDVEIRFPSTAGPRSLFRSIELSAARPSDHESALVGMFERLERELIDAIFRGPHPSST